MSILKCERIAKAYTLPEQKTPHCVFKDLNLEVREKEFVSVLGHSGCGKSTLLNIIAGIDKTDSGGVLLDNHEVYGPGLDRMVVFQNFALMPWMSVFNNIRLAVRAANPKWKKSRVNEQTRRYLEMVGLKGSENKKPAALSGGMRQRVGLARAFSVQPRIMLLDEPFAQIDALTRGVIQEELVRMWEATGITIFMVTHDVDESILLSDRVLLMSAGPEAEIKLEIDVDIERPRSRSKIIEHPDYYKIRNRIITFLSGSDEIEESKTPREAVRNAA
jgi:nitrate/nitrite transport system ATP-binding protein